jgi:hypothetical protein
MIKVAAHMLGKIAQDIAKQSIVTDCASASDIRSAGDEHTSAVTTETPTVPAKPMDDKTGDDDSEPHLFPVLPAKDVLRDWAKRLSKTKISPADSSKPAKLSPTDKDKKQPIHRRGADNIPLHPPVPQIIISGPEDSSTPVLPETQPEPSISLFSYDKKDVPSKSDAELYTCHRAPKRIRTINPSTKKYTAPASGSKDGNTTPHVPLVSSRLTLAFIPTCTSRDLKLKIRHSTVADTAPAVDIVLVYIYNSTMYDELNDRDGDLDLFRSILTSDTLTTKPILSKRLQRARTDFATASTSAGLAPVDRENKPVHQSHSRSSNTPSTNWITDDDMLSKHIPESRVITVGFDMSLHGHDLPSASTRLLEYLQKVRTGNETPLIFLGHTLGGLIVLEALFIASRCYLAEQILYPTAGVLLFLCPTRISGDTSALALIHKTGVDADAIENAYGNIKSIGAQIMRSSVFSVVQTYRQPGDKVFTTKANRKEIVTGFPVVQILTHDDLRPTVEDAFNDFIGVPSQTMVLYKEASQAVQFSGPEDTDFKQVVEIIKETLSGRRLILAAIAGDCDDINIMLKARMDPNLGDRW